MLTSLVNCHSIVEMAMTIIYLILCFGATVVLCSESPCTTPSGETATCKELSDCDILLPIVASKDPTLKKFLKASSCGTFMVCCGTSSNFTAPKVSAVKVNATAAPLTKQEKKKLLPVKFYCGYEEQDIFGFYIVKNTSLAYNNEFPWLLYISLYKQQNQGFEGIYELRCTGVLINNRYALTASECNAIPFDSVQIGQHDRFKNRSCITLTASGLESCNDPSETYAVEEKIVHKNGLLLIRFAKNVTFTNYIKPICLPMEEADNPKVGSALVSSGWGDVTLEVENVKAKKKISHVLREPVSEDVIYVNSTKYTDCFGDEGGPLMHLTTIGDWILDAIIPPYFCLKNVPARRVNQEIIDWIIENIRP